MGQAYQGNQIGENPTTSGMNMTNTGSGSNKSGMNMTNAGPGSNTSGMNIPNMGFGNMNMNPGMGSSGSGQMGQNFQGNQPHVNPMMSAMNMTYTGSMNDMSSMPQQDDFTKAFFEYNMHKDRYAYDKPSNLSKEQSDQYDLMKIREIMNQRMNNKK